MPHRSNGCKRNCWARGPGLDLLARQNVIELIHQESLGNSRLIPTPYYIGVKRKYDWHNMGVNWVRLCTSFGDNRGDVTFLFVSFFYNLSPGLAWLAWYVSQAHPLTYQASSELDLIVKMLWDSMYSVWFCVFLFRPLVRMLCDMFYSLWVCVSQTHKE